MKSSTASATAYLIAESTVLSADTAALASLIPPGAAEICARFVQPRTRAAGRRGNLRRTRLGRAVLDAMERITIPGLRLHYALRKKYLEEAARTALGNGFEQVVVFGAGFDTLAVRLAREFPLVQFIEVDHPATQQAKVAALRDPDKPSNLEFVALELTSARWPAALCATVFEPTRRTLFVAEGLLMYLSAAEVDRLFTFVAGTASGRFLFTFMEQNAEGRIAFRNSTFLVDLWLKLRGEPFKWGVARDGLGEFLDRRGFALSAFADAAELRQRYLTPALAHLTSAEGESIGLADVADVRAGANKNERQNALFGPPSAVFGRGDGGEGPKDDGKHRYQFVRSPRSGRQTFQRITRLFRPLRGLKHLKWANGPHADAPSPPSPLPEKMGEGGRIKTSSRSSPGTTVNDIHSQLNETRVAAVVTPASIEELQAAIRRARLSGLAVCVGGGWHAMGGQQFATGAVLIDMAHLNRVVSFDPDRRSIEVEAGIRWPELVAWLVNEQAGRRDQLGIAQKQTGADRLSLGGALSANIHGRGLTMRPIIGDVESFTLVDAEGELRCCSRTENAELFRLAIGGYGLFGVIVTVNLRLAPRRRVERVVRIEQIENLPELFAARIREGYLYGDFQFATERTSDDFLRCGVFSCYRPVEAAPFETADDQAPQRELSADDWRQLLYLAHIDRQRAFALYSAHYLATDGQVYWSDTHQLSVYLDHYHTELDRQMSAPVKATEMITELYVPRASLTAFMDRVRADFREHEVELIYGTIRLIERDQESFLAWAREDFACVVFNLHVTHDDAGLAKAAADFRRLIDRALALGGSYYLTYHRWATLEQVLAAYPQMPEFLAHKLRYDPTELFQSDWYRAVGPGPGVRGREPGSGGREPVAQ
jgi:methyltransferase (TIGR00027 family)